VTLNLEENSEVTFTIFFPPISMTFHLQLSIRVMFGDISQLSVTHVHSHYYIDIAVVFFTPNS